MQTTISVAKCPENLNDHTNTLLWHRILLAFPLTCFLGITLKVLIISPGNESGNVMESITY